MSIPSTHVSWTKIWVVIGALGVPGIIGFTIIVRGTQQLLDHVSVIDTKVTYQGVDIKQMKADIINLHTSIDTISHRQDVDRIKNSYQYQMQQTAVKQGPNWFEQVKDSRGKIHLKRTTNP